ncbi:hypothetical protein [Nitrosomonas sp.]|uniref:hypothetical protein n=1 Tax=Nitrosomonas sp. TaxID=42353 RepID=UPI002631AFCC|nr:hypothetical protein [Nitrosomonas sp.]MCW5599971.1 hypothetical protein [Nitrosomonas sp.]
MTGIEYKILFEVRFLHDYYLYGLEPGAGSSMKSFFAMSAENQSARLTELLKSGRYDMRKDLDLLIGASEERLFKNLRLKLVRTATGFFLGMQIERVVTNSGEIRFKPVILPSEDTYVMIGLSIANPYFGSISNLRLDRDVDKIYYFTNEGDHDDISLAALTPPLVSGQQYRMGDLSLVAGKVKQAIADNTGNTRFWSTVDGKGIVSQSDRSLDSQQDWYSEWRSTISLRSKHPVGVIKIALMSGNGQFRPIDENKLLTTRFHEHINTTSHPVYELRWLSRKTYWRYSKRDGFSTKEREHIMNGAGSLVDIESDKFITKDPWPITRDHSRLPWPGASIRLPNAQPGSIKADGGKIFSDIEFNELIPVLREA